MIMLSKYAVLPISLSLSPFSFDHSCLDALRVLRWNRGSHRCTIFDADGGYPLVSGNVLHLGSGDGLTESREEWNTEDEIIPESIASHV